MRTLKNLLLASVVGGATLGMSSCSENTENGGGGSGAGSQTIEATWSNYAGYTRVVSEVLERDAFSIYALWKGTNNLPADEVGRVEELEIPAMLADGYGNLFKKHQAGSTYPSAKVCLQTIIAASVDIATEVSEQKIAAPYNEKNVYGVESWYSFNSYTDYDDNIESIENAYLGGPENNRDEATSLYAAVKAVNASLAEQVKSDIEASHQALKAAKEQGCFRDAVLAYANNNIKSPQVEQAITTIGTLSQSLDQLNGAVEAISETVADQVVTNYVDRTVIPTYTNLKNEAGKLVEAVSKYTQNPTQENLDAACQQWKQTRIPWERSEAFLFGPVADQQFDPHLDSWPLSQLNIKSILRGNFDWANEDGSSMGANTLGFHTLELLLFENGNPRQVKTFIKDGMVTIQ